MIKTLIRDWSTERIPNHKSVSFRENSQYLNKITVNKAFMNLSVQANPSEDNPARRLSLLSPQSEWIENPDLQQKIEEKRLTRAFRSRGLPNNLKHFVRRKSCCCKWCGGVSKFELKVKDIAYCDKKLNEISLSPTNQSRSSLTKLRNIGLDMKTICILGNINFSSYTS